MSLVWAVLASGLLTIEVRRTTAAGLVRFHALDPERARAVVEPYRSGWLPWLNLGWAVLNAANGVGALLEGDAVDAAAHGAAAVLLVVLVVVQRRNRPRVLAEAEKREIAGDLEVVPRPSSRRRRRRQRQLGSLTVGCLVLGPLLLTAGELGDSGATFVTGLVVLGVAALAGLGYGWATAWVYGDEEPVVRDERPQRTG